MMVSAYAVHLLASAVHPSEARNTMMGYAVYLMANVVHHSEFPHVHDSKFRTISLDSKRSTLDTQDGLHKTLDRKCNTLQLGFL